MTRASPSRILLIQLHHLGDVVLATPAIRAARQAFPEARIDFITGPLGAQVLEANPHLDTILVGPSMHWLFSTRYDAVADMHSVPRTALYTIATRARTRIGIRGRGPRNLAYTELLPREGGPVYMARQKLRLLAPLGIAVNTADARLEITIETAQRGWARATVAGHKGVQPLVAISPVAKHAFKQWGPANWAAVADALAEHGARILITSGPGEAAQARAVAERMKHPALWEYGPTTVRQLAALYEQCALWLGNDGGPKHIAVAAGTPTVTVIRKRLGLVWSDPDDRKQVSINSESESLQSVQPSAVISAARAFLSSQAYEDRK
ncbi:MAG TPA: glycosyltransferase family 9 protein [Longimicrobiales bacterium]